LKIKLKHNLVKISFIIEYHEYQTGMQEIVQKKEVFIKFDKMKYKSFAVQQISQNTIWI